MYDVPPYWDVQACTGSVSYNVRGYRQSYGSTLATFNQPA